LPRNAPAPLVAGDRIAVVAPAGPCDPTALEAGVSWLARRFDPVISPECYARDGFLAGEDSLRLSGLQRALADPEVKAVIAARGGYGTTRILADLDLDGFARAPKWVVGSSDLTALLVQLHAGPKIPSIHGPMAARFGDADEGDLTLTAALLEGAQWRAPENLEPLFVGQGRGPLVGGILTVLSHLVGTISVAFAEGAILFLEDVGERPYRLDRCLIQLARAGIFDRVAGILLGDFTDCDPGPDGTSANDVLRRSLGGLGVPVAAGYPAAHGGRNHPFVHGAEVSLAVSGSSVTLSA